MEDIVQKYVKLFSKEIKVCSRKDYWIFILFNLFVLLLFTSLVWVIDIIYEYGANWNFYSFFTSFIFLLLGLLTIILGTKRLRDVGISPWFMLLGLVPYVNIILIILLCLPSNIVKSKIPTTYVGK